MSELASQQHLARPVRRRKRLRNPKRLLLFLLALGLTGLCLGFGLIVASVTQHNVAFQTYGLLYIAASLAILIFRLALRAVHHLRKRKYSGTS